MKGMAAEAECRSNHLLGLSKSVNHQKSDWHGVAAPIRHAITLLCETLHEQMAGMQRAESEVARLRIQVGSTEHSQAALEATVQGQLDACVRHVEKRLFKAAQAKVARDELEDCIQQVRDRVEHIVSEGLASTVAPLQQQINADSQHTSQMCVRMDALDAQQKKLVLRVAKHQKQISADILAVQDLQPRMSNVEEASLRTGDAVSAAQACALQVGRQWDAAQQEHEELRQKLDQLATSTEQQLRETASSSETQMKDIEFRTTELERKGGVEQRLEGKMAPLVAGQRRLEQALRAEQEGRKELGDGLGARVASLEQAQQAAEERREAAMEALRGEVREGNSRAAREAEKQAARVDALDSSVAATPRLIQEANEAAVAGLVAQMSILGRATEEAASRAGGADDRAREAAAVAAQNQAVFKGLAASMTQLTRKIESAEQRAEGEKGRVDGLGQKQHKLTLSVHTAVAEQMAHVPTTTHVERLLAAQSEKLQAEWRAGQEQVQQEGALRDARLQQLQLQQENTQKVADQLKAGVAEVVTSAALEAALASAVAPLNRELREERAGSAQLTQRLSDVEEKLQQQVQQLQKGAIQLQTSIAGAVTSAALGTALADVTAVMNKELKDERNVSTGLTERLASLESKLEAVRDDTVQRLETRVSAAQSAAEEQAAQRVDSETAVIRQQLAALSAQLSQELSSVRESLQEQIDHRCQELSANCRSRAAEQAGQLADQAKQMEPALLKLTQQMEGIQRLCRQELQSVRAALEGKASNDQMSELKGVLSEVDKLRSQLNSGTSTPRRSAVGSTLRPTNWKM